MVDLNDLHKSVLRRYSRAIVHMRSQVLAKRFGLVFGAGLSKPFGIPTWGDLAVLLADDSEVQGKEVLLMAPPRASLPYRTEMLFEHFKQRRYSDTSPERWHTRQLDYEIAAEWREIIRGCLYSGVATELAETLDGHPYLMHYLPIIRRSHMTVTYNFDDFIEQSLSRSREGEDLDSRGFESVTNPWTQFRR